MNRPFFNFRISELEVEFAARRDDVEFLHFLIDELGYRSNPKAAKLQILALDALAKLQKPSRPAEPEILPSPRAAPPSQPERNPPAPPGKLAGFVASAVSDHRPSTSEVSDEPEAILDTWTALEVLSPQTFRRPEDLAGGDRQAVAWFDRERLPWEGAGEKARRNTKLFYQVVLGTVDLGEAINQLLARYADSRVERPAARGEAILAIVIVDREGRLVELPAVSVSSFAWGAPLALQGDLTGLAEWRRAEGPLIEGIDEVIRRSGDDEENLPLDRAAITAGWEWLVTNLGLQRDLVKPPRFAIRSYEYYKSSEPPEPLLLNSFFLNDLGTARSLFSQGKATPNLRRYIGRDMPATRHDLLHDRNALEAAVAPGIIPPARWPGPSRHPLVLLQQASVNLALRELRDTGILAVNGPPGTGKTTLLRDLVAAVVTARAEAMTAFDDPATAFTHSGEKLKAGSGWLHLYRLDACLKGFEMLVASSNNKAVENVSAELPDLKAIAEDAGDLRYFSTLSDALRQRETWGLVAAILGNAANRGRFKKTFWWEEDVGLSTYLAEASGTPQFIEITDPETGTSETRPPRIVAEEKPPRSHEEALRKWQTTRSAFRAALEKSRKNLKELARIRELSMSLPTLAREEDTATATALTMQNAKAGAQAAAETAYANLATAQSNCKDAEEKLAQHDQTAPGFFARLFRTRRARSWQSARVPLAEISERTQQVQALASRSLSECDERLRQAIAQWQAAEQHRSAVAAHHASSWNEVKAARERIGAGFIDESFFDLNSEVKHKIAPWLNAEQQRARDDVFVAAMALHKAFADAAAKPLRHNLGALMSTFGSRALPTAEKRALAPDLWASLFLVVPLISTTFASVERMLGDLPLEGLGWLFVDEAGQALPQAAVGALMRTRRAVIVGDPVQIEPIVVLPDTLTHAICRHFGVDPDRFNAPNASAQTLADAATPFLAEFQGRHGSRTVGVPLLVHRRCSEPMFSISNAVAYDRLMVNAKVPNVSRVGEILGPSAWIDVRGSAVEKWCPEEGDKVLTLLQRLAEAEVGPNLYIVTPFVIVVDNLRRLVRESSLIVKWTDDPRSWASEHIGTVHTVQGREAEAVIFVLGAPAAHQTGARTWAGGRPNLLNVAVTRAKERLYVIGNRSLWREAGLFRELDARLPGSEACS